MKFWQDVVAIDDELQRNWDIADQRRRGPADCAADGCRRRVVIRGLEPRSHGSRLQAWAVGPPTGIPAVSSFRRQSSTSLCCQQAGPGDRPISGYRVAHRTRLRHGPLTWRPRSPARRTGLEQVVLVGHDYSFVVRGPENIIENGQHQCKSF